MNCLKGRNVWSFGEGRLVVQLERTALNELIKNIGGLSPVSVAVSFIPELVEE